MAELRALRGRLSSLGIDLLDVDERTTGESRRVRLTNQSAAIGTVSCASFAAVYAIAGSSFLAPLFANVVAIVLLIAALFFSQRGARTLSKVLVLGPVNGVVVVASMLLGGRVGFLYYLFVTAVVAFLLFSTKQWALRVAFALLSATCCVVALVFPTPTAIAALITPTAATAWWRSRSRKTPKASRCCSGSGTTPPEPRRRGRFAWIRWPPATTARGALLRLGNMGYYRGEPKDEMDDDARQALRDFQAHVGLPVTGTLDGATADKITTLHGK